MCGEIRSDHEPRGTNTLDHTNKQVAHERYELDFVVVVSTERNETTQCLVCPIGTEATVRIGKFAGGHGWQYG